MAGGPSDSAKLSMAVVHAPYLRTLDAFTADAYPLILAGHTHGGQLCIPFYGALVTNCDLDTDRVKGLSTHTARSRTSYLHVSAGCGTNRYTPVRFACPPKATLLTLVGRIQSLPMGRARGWVGLVGSLWGLWEPCGPWETAGDNVIPLTHTARRIAPYVRFCQRGGMTAPIPRDIPDLPAIPGKPALKPSPVRHGRRHPRPPPGGRGLPPAGRPGGGRRRDAQTGPG
ncbi:hypothetical protein SVIOM74S_06765 [Streptomyces violarus]